MNTFFDFENNFSGFGSLSRVFFDFRKNFSGFQLVLARDGEGGPSALDT